MDAIFGPLIQQTKRPWHDAYFEAGMPLEAALFARSTRAEHTKVLSAGPELYRILVGHFLEGEENVGNNLHYGTIDQYAFRGLFRRLWQQV
jgi:hypothetical protein